MHEKGVKGNLFVFSFPPDKHRDVLESVARFEVSRERISEHFVVGASVNFSCGM